ncbi:MAG: hypothetical protein K8L97_04755 [Anaerolineae bacterium]|nr:hypothetical protein [Anaerolineae bacterium]
MLAQADLLWRINNEYRKRLTQAQTFLDLLEQVMLAHSGDVDTLAPLRYAREMLNALTEEHRAWRYRFYYESPESKRMVQDDRAINQALARFSRMHTQHETRLYDLYNILNESPRPDPLLTRVPTGDLWDMTGYALNDLISFGEYMGSL